MLDLLEQCHVFQTSFSTNALSMAAAEGERNIGLILLGEIMAACPAEYVRMMEERNARSSAADLADYRADNDSDDPDDRSADLFDDGIAEPAPERYEGPRESAQPEG
jgi:hypothetical protein